MAAATTFLLAALAFEGKARAGTAAADELPAVELSAAYTAEGWAVAGGRDEGSVYLDNLDVGLQINLDALGWRGGAARVSGLYNNRNQLSQALIGDFQAVSNIDADGSPRLYELWIEQRFGDALRAKAGVVDLNSEFDVNETGALFINSSHGIAPEFSQVGANGPSIFPAPGLGALVEARRQSWSARFGIFEGVPRDPERPRRTVFGLRRDEGALAVFEVEHRRNELRVMAGLFHHSGRFERWATPEQLFERNPVRSTGAYLLVEGALARWGDRRLRGFTRLGIADRRIHEVAAYAGAGLVLDGTLLGLEDEQLGVAIASARNGRPYRRTQPEGDAAVLETAIELTYSAAILPWLSVQPDVQWILNPGFSRRTSDALAIGLRITAAIDWRSSPSGSRQ